MPTRPLRLEGGMEDFIKSMYGGPLRRSKKAYVPWNNKATKIRSETRYRMLWDLRDSIPGNGEHYSRANGPLTYGDYKSKKTFWKG
jgi:hypothetical protein